MRTQIQKEMTCPRRPTQSWIQLGASLSPLLAHASTLSSSKIHKSECTVGPKHLQQDSVWSLWHSPAVISINRPTTTWNSLESSEQLSMLTCLYVVSWP